MICINTSLGLHTPNLFPTKTGRDYELTPYLEPLQKFRDESTVFSGLASGSGWRPSRRVVLSHRRAHPARITLRTRSRSISMPSSDWSRTRGLVCSALSSSSSRGLSFTRSGVPIPAEERPSRVFKNMFVAGSAAEINAKCNGSSRARALWIRCWRR